MPGGGVTGQGIKLTDFHDTLTHTYTYTYIHTHERERERERDRQRENFIDNQIDD